jgi:hypothetical protein
LILQSNPLPDRSGKVVNGVRWKREKEHEANGNNHPLDGIHTRLTAGYVDSRETATALAP